MSRSAMMPAAADQADTHDDDELESEVESAPTAPTAPALTEREEQILAFERKWWKHAGAKEQAIRDAFDLSATRYYQLLNGLLDNPAALAADPVVVGRLRRLRSTRARSRRR
ncbi:DUF3263 domain-containing protein [Asanoa sp. WMMD1127]|uniref:DUF3263 domain-containing protein n=1 Tax=Asanoa sp. WMMD1127 TaxID=3016107 RepID=UPI002415AE16|nr:DUF3263 domain-containing protein [Asanoa sp. WMMD1127]MDG4822486.1 DUF3263 domain-containing protein [Asanoa sp. WMMD1127]